MMTQNVPPSHVKVACVADALNLLYIASDYTNGLDECVGRLQRRLCEGRYIQNVEQNYNPGLGLISLSGTRPSIWNLESTAWNPESKTVEFLYIWQQVFAIVAECLPVPFRKISFPHGLTYANKSHTKNKTTTANTVKKKALEFFTSTALSLSS